MPGAGSAGPARVILQKLGATAIVAATAGCAGGAPLLHPAHVLTPGNVTAGAGLSGQLPLRKVAVSTSSPTLGGPLQTLTVAPGVAPWVGARIGIPGSNEGGLTYSGRAIRLDGRHAFSLGAPTLSAGLGVSALMARRPGEGNDPSSVYGIGFDLPLLLGFKSRSDLYSLWFGPRGGVELFSGRIAVGTDKAAAPADVSGRHVHVGFLAGVRVGFRRVYVALEVDGSYHRADGTFSGSQASLSQFSITPSGALQLAF
jgi:hypothetical protein